VAIKNHPLARKLGGKIAPRRTIAVKQLGKNGWNPFLYYVSATLLSK